MEAAQNVSPIEDREGNNLEGTMVKIEDQESDGTLPISEEDRTHLEAARKKLVRRQKAVAKIKAMDVTLPLVYRSTDIQYRGKIASKVEIAEETVVEEMDTTV